jgi:hypothetical protein
MVLKLRRNSQIILFLTQILTKELALGGGKWVASPTLELKKRALCPLKGDYGENH